MDLWGSLLEDGKAELREGVASQGFINTYLRKRADTGLENAPGNNLTEDGWMRDKLVAYTAGTLLEAGSDTTANSIQSFVLFMLSNSHVLRRVRDEVDQVIGLERMPDFEDEQRLPYLVACIKETLRRRPPIIMGVPHKAEEDDMYEGYLIPKGSTVIGNVWAIHMDPARFPNPTSFNPERFYDPEKLPSWGSGPDSLNRDHYAFSWGRRFCQGSYIAEASLFIALSRLIWGIDFAAPINEQTAQPVIPDMAHEEANWSEGFVSGPRIYGVIFKARSEKHAELIRKSYEKLQNEWQMAGMAADER